MEPLPFIIVTETGWDTELNGPGKSTVRADKILTFDQKAMSVPMDADGKTVDIIGSQVLLFGAGAPIMFETREDPDELLDLIENAMEGEISVGRPE